MKRITLLSITLAFYSFGAAAQELPANPTPGKCYIKCITKDEFKQVTETIQVSPAYKKLTIVPGTFKTIEEKVLIKEATKKLIYVPAVFETTTVPYTAKEGIETLSVLPASFGKDSKTVETYPVTGKWEYTKMKNCPSANKEDCMTLCFVEYPSKSEAVSITTLSKDASTNQASISAQQSSYKKLSVKVPARTEEVIIPAEYSVIKKQVVDRKASTTEEVVAAVTKTVTKTELVKKGGVTVWEEVDCSLVGTNNLLNILYEYNSAKLTSRSTEDIDQNLLKLLNDKPNLRVEIMSHTDSRGNDSYNKSLSQQRAQSVVNYLVSKGISRDRLEARGYGESQLKNNCSNGVACSENQHQLNRRTEFRIL